MMLPPGLAVSTLRRRRKRRERNEFQNELGLKGMAKLNNVVFNDVVCFLPASTFLFAQTTNFHSMSFHFMSSLLREDIEQPTKHSQKSAPKIRSDPFNLLFFSISGLSSSRSCAIPIIPRIDRIFRNSSFEIGLPCPCLNIRVS